MNIKRVIAAGIAAASLLAVGACGNSSSASKDDKTITFWHNATSGAGKKYWNDLAAAFTKKTGVKVKISSYQNEDWANKITTALQDPASAPDVFFNNIYADLQSQSEAGLLKDITNDLDSDVKSNMGNALSQYTIDGKTYGVPVSVSPGGFWYSKDLFKKAGIEKTPTTIEELSQDVSKLKAAGISPIALGAKDGWPASHWFYHFALRLCGTDTYAKGQFDYDFSDSCWTKAATETQDFASTDPFNKGFLTTSAQQGAGSSAGLVANHKAAMELMGAFEPGVIADLTPDKKPLSDLGYFPFPAVEGGKDTSSMLLGEDGFVVSAQASDKAVDFVNFIANKENQEKYSDAFQAVPANQSAQGAVTNEALKEMVEYYKKADKTFSWWGGNVGNVVASTASKLMSKAQTPEAFMKALEAAAKQDKQ